MTKIINIEELEIWQEARELAKSIFLLTSIDPFKKDYRFRDQIRAAAGSIMDNISEGFCRGGTKEFIQFLCIAKGSCCETRSQIYRAYDCNYITKTQLDEFLQKTGKISGKIGSFIEYLKSCNYKGTKYL